MSSGTGGAAIFLRSVSSGYFANPMRSAWIGL
jgi:hypothetical protein